MRVHVTDLFALTKRELTPEKFLIAPANISRAGNVQDYRARELGLDGDPERIVRLYRPATEVFSPATLASFESKPITLDHPPEDVTAENWDRYAIGDVHGIAAADGFTTGRVIVRHKDAVRDVLDGKSQMSCGYSFELDMTPGTSPDGQRYDGVQRNIRGNHLAIVDAARGGASCRIADEESGHQGTHEGPPVGVDLHIERSRTGWYLQTPAERAALESPEPSGVTELTGAALHVERSRTGWYLQREAEHAAMFTRGEGSR